MKLKFKDDYPLDKIDIMQGAYRAIFERKNQPFEVPDEIGEMLLKTKYPCRIDKPDKKVSFEDRDAFEHVIEEPKPKTKKAEGV